MMSWFRKRRSEKLINLLGRHVEFVTDSVVELNIALMMIAEKRYKEARASIERLIISEEEADRLCREIDKEATKGEIPPKYRQDLLQLVNIVDNVADWAKDASKDLWIFLDMGIELPSKIMVHILEIGNFIKDMALALEDAIKSLLFDLDKSIELTVKIECLEKNVDELYFKVKKTLFEVDRPAAQLIAIKDILQALENLADSEEDASDVLKMIAIMLK
ncbi:MAG: DUF47 domain-containing protein [Candidatus Asgardarchaeia archaeon]